MIFRFEQGLELWAIAIESDYNDNHYRNQRPEFSMEITSVTRSQMDLAVVGAGPHALTLVTHLLQKCQKKRGKFWVFDPSGGWLTQWERQFAALEIPHLRSPAVHHPDPNAFELRRFAESRPNELFAPYDLPGSRLFEEFCGDVVERWELGDRVIKAKITRIEPLAGSFRLWFEDGESAIARRVAIATGGGKPQLPEWTNQIQTPYPPDKLCHSHQVNLRGLKLQGERILIVHARFSKPCKFLKQGLIFACLAVGSISATSTISSKLQQTPGSDVVTGKYARAKLSPRESPKPPIASLKMRSSAGMLSH